MKSSFFKYFLRIFPFIVVLIPLFYLDLPWWADLLLVLVLGILPIIGNVGEIVLWVIALVHCISSVQNAAAIVYYVLFAIIFLPYEIFAIWDFINRRKHPAQYM